MPTRDSLKRVILILAPLGALLAAGAWIQQSLENTLLAPIFLSGWLLGILLGLSALTWWRAAPSPGDLRKRLLGQLIIGSLMLLLFLVHTQLRLPQGWLQRSLSVGFELLMLGLITGGLLVYDSKTSLQGLRRWLRFQTSLHWGLLSIALFHGIFSHVHCALAHLLFDSE